MTELGRSGSFFQFVAAALAAAVLVSCSTPTNRHVLAGEQGITADRVLSASPLAKGVTAKDIASDDILDVSPEMSAFLDEHVDRDGSQNERLAQLILTIIGGERFRLAYDGSTHTARGTFDNRRGNCISFTNMFVAMARNVGLKASYQEVDIPPDWSMTGEIFLLSKHVNALVELKNALPRVVDFNTVDYDVNSDMHVITDQRARAHYYNNIGVEHLLAGETKSAFANLRQSLEEDESFGSAWVNLGILHRREGYPDYAEAAFLKALDYDESDLMAMSNLASLYEEQGRMQEADFYLSKVKAHRMKNPYYHYQLASTAFNEGDYREAIAELKTAISQRRDDDRFYYLMSLSYLMSGDKQKANRWMKKAEEVAQQSESQKKYRHKLDLMRSLQDGS